MVVTRPEEAADVDLAKSATAPEPEPRLDAVALRFELRTLVATDPAAAARELPARIAAALWDDWRRDLEALGVGSADLKAAAGDFRRELWLWVMGERTWAQTASSLAGRAERRVA
jgi:hypothetical protein